MCVVDTSGSMTMGYNRSSVKPIDVAISLGMYCGERIGEPFKDYFISFSSKPQLIKIEGIDFVDKVARIYKQNLCQDTNLTAVFDMLLKMYKNGAVKMEDMPEQLIVISDMNIDCGSHWHDKHRMKTEMELIREEWSRYNLNFPRLVYWNVNARNNLILDNAEIDGVSFVSGCSPTVFQAVINNKSGWDICYDTLMSDRYKKVF